jgi:hypothetical protein
MMKALTVRQFHASLIIWGEKEFEGRTRRTNYRGEFALHAGQSTSEIAALHLMLKYSPDSHPVKMNWNNAVGAHGNIAPFDLPRGVVLGIVKLVDCIPVGQLKLSAKERAFGYWELNKWAWQMEVIEVFDKPVPALGNVTWWNWERHAA